MATLNYLLKGTSTLKHIYAKLYYRDSTGNLKILTPTKLKLISNGICNNYRLCSSNHIH